MHSKLNRLWVLSLYQFRYRGGDVHLNTGTFGILWHVHLCLILSERGAMFSINIWFYWWV